MDGCEAQLTSLQESLTAEHITQRQESYDCGFEKGVERGIETGREQERRVWGVAGHSSICIAVPRPPRIFRDSSIQVYPTTASAFAQTDPTTTTSISVQTHHPIDSSPPQLLPFKQILLSFHHPPHQPFLHKLSH
jgi:hypothetical protein